MSCQQIMHAYWALTFKQCLFLQEDQVQSQLYRLRLLSDHHQCSRKHSQIDDVLHSHVIRQLKQHIHSN